MQKLIIMTMKLIILIIIDMEASEHAHPSHLDSIHCPLQSCLETQLEDCVEKRVRLIQHYHHRCICSSFLHCFYKVVAHDPGYLCFKKAQNHATVLSLKVDSCLLEYIT
jgi:hypothetical protein